MPFQIIRNDITKVKADAIVNSANPAPKYDLGVDTAIYKAAGEKELLAERVKIGAIARGDIAVTPAFNLNAKYIIHAVGPVWKDGDSGEYGILQNCYRKSLEKALELKCRSIAFPLLATGVYGFPKSKALSIAIDEIGAFLTRDDVDDMKVILVVYDKASFLLSENLFYRVESYINDEDVRRAYEEEFEISEDRWGMRQKRRWRELELEEQCIPLCAMMSAPVIEPDGPPPNEDDGGSIGRNPLGQPFNEDTFDPSGFMDDGKDKLYFKEALMKFIIEKGLDNNVVWKKANMTRKAFSKIMTGETKNPQKKAVLALCISLELTLDEAEELLASNDMAFNPHNNRDRLIMDCIRHGQYNTFVIDSMLVACNLPTIGS